MKTKKYRVIRIKDKEEDSIFSILSKSKYYNENKEKIFKEKFYDIQDYYYYDKGDVSFFIKTFMGLPKTAKEEFKKRSDFVLSLERSGRREEDFERIAQKIRKFQNEIEDLPKDEQIKTVDKLINYYTYKGDDFLNSVARGMAHPIRIGTTLWDYGMMSEDLCAKTISELNKIRDRIKEKRTFEGDTLYRGVPLDSFLEAMNYKGGDLLRVVDDLSKNTRDATKIHIKRNERTIKSKLETYFKHKIYREPAIMSTSSVREKAEVFMKGWDGILLIIDVRGYKYGLDIKPYTEYPGEHEVLLPPGTKLKLTSVSEISITPHSDNRIQICINCKPF